MDPVQVLQYFLSGLTSGAVYAVVGIGFDIVYNATGIINFAQGDFLMLGGMIAVSLAPHMGLAAAVFCASAATGCIGVLLHVVFIRWLRKPAVLRLIIITIGISILLREAALRVWDEKVRALPFFSGDETSSLSVLGARISPQVLWVLGIAALIVAGLSLFFRFTLTGKAMRACASNQSAARLCGVDASGLVTLSFFLSAALGALAGCAVSPITQTSYDMGTPLAVKGFTCAVLGGLGSPTAAVAAGLLVGLVESFSVSVLPLAFKDVASLCILLAILVLRPQGLFGAMSPVLKGSAR
jgi:branched-chain amino acid transport system permease protein